MSHHDTEEHLSPEEKKFRNCIELGDNFMKIEIFYLADRWYGRAVELQPDNKEALNKWEDSKRLHKKENQTIYKVVAAMALIVLIIIGVRVL
jgi:hypothetical protein